MERAAPARAAGGAPRDRGDARSSPSGAASGARPYTLGVRVVAGLWATSRSRSAPGCAGARRSRALVDHQSDGDADPSGLWNTVAEQYPLDAIADARVTKERDGKGSPAYRVELVLQTGGVVRVPPTCPNDRTGCMRAAEHLWKALELPRA
ncbi:MAG: hypothetical protein MZV49_15470 [Rhodopseudomonas palustris]|nr:hypothetical protein [Rhodopseudomonas palustris]